jgi:hypothetical protein
VYKLVGKTEAIGLDNEGTAHGRLDVASTDGLVAGFDGDCTDIDQRLVRVCSGTDNWWNNFSGNSWQSRKSGLRQADPVVCSAEADVSSN